MTSGLHHITLITRKVQANVDFYAGFLGLRLVKKTAGFEDVTQLHLFYGDGVATPGSLITFLVWEDGSPGRVGHGAPSEVGLAIRPEAIGFWLTRALQFGVKASGPTMEFGEPVLRLSDPDGIIVKLVGTDEVTSPAPWTSSGITEADTITGLRGATILSEKPAETVGFLTRYSGFAEHARENRIVRLGSEAGGIIDVRDAGGFWTAAPGTGTIDHIAVRMADRATVETTSRQLNDEAHGPTSVHDRKYFYSLYVREPGGALIEMATDAPGFAIDESVDDLGSRLFIPAHFSKVDPDIDTMLPQFGMPGEPRTIYRELPFVHRLHVPDNPDGSTLFLLHGTGGSEASLMPFGHRIAPNSTLIGLRGRAHEEGVARFFRRFSTVTFDQKDIAAEVEALAAFVEGAIAAYDIDPDRVAFLGYSNGANMLGAAMLLRPNVVKQAMLLRAMMVLEQTPAVNRSRGRVLMVTGTDDQLLPYASSLEQALSASGSEIVHRNVKAGHALIDEDERLARAWFEEGSRHQAS